MRIMKEKTNMEILKGQSYEIENLVSRSGKFTTNELQTIEIELLNTFKNNAIHNGEYIITTTRAVEDEGRIMDVEILLPMNGSVKVKEPYTFKKRIKIVNALYMKLADIKLLQEAINEINGYIMGHKLQPVTSAYIVQSKEKGIPCTEIYIGISTNIL